MKANRIFTIIAVLFLALPVAGQAQFFKKLGKELGNAVLDGVKDGISGENKQQKSNLQESDIPASNRPAPVEGTKIVTNHPDLKIKIKRCEVSGRTCVIDLIVTNYGADTYIRYIFGSSGRNDTYAIDDEANQYELAVQAANSQPTYDTIYDIPLLTDTPIKARIQIENVASAATMFKRIHLIAHCNALGLNDYKPIMFYNIPISREGDE